MQRIITLIEKDQLRQEALHCVSQLALPQCYLAAGFVRNLVWDHLHPEKPITTPLNDLDVIYFDPTESDPSRDIALEQQLSDMMPNQNWQVRNQARMHGYNGDRPYLSTLDAMRFWPEKETAIAIRKVPTTAGRGGYQGISAFGVDSLFDLKITHNPRRSRALFEQRIQAKQWLVHWPKLTIGSFSDAL
ncbi:nucleotidyltransferase family protein [Photobacterium swingsii]|uniref:nucleotidyltransferase family protein n=1 Tax=Photobacterium swingsii TaxID=680026 RepID=UPI003D0AB704